MDSFSLEVVYRKQSYTVQGLRSDTTVAQLRQAIEELTYVAADKQKLLVPRTAGVADLNHGADERTLGDVGLASKAETKVTVLGPSSSELEALYSAEADMQRRNAPRQYHPSLLRGAKLRNTTQPGLSHSPFGKIYAHATTPESSPLHGKVVDYLTRLSRDPGILHICALNHFRVGALTELLPWEHPGLLGLNENAGQRILLRIRTDDAEGFRDYKTTRRVLVHELAHNKVADHPPEFKILNSKLNAQIEEYERAQRDGTHRLVEGDVYEPSPPTISGGGQRLGGGSGAESESAEERRQRVLMATMRRLEREEHEIEQSCGSATTKPNHSP
ncbi:protein involved in sister chromatid separation and/or segregation [Moesziomyces antarcticus T-34]|uniref:Protein involved in sister chromatid separation and/or segregation n=1 Tax=Pseudozyma antarctica (strain T-34) TaxID=1151754 RepID=M9LWL4_PSEA3|nr:protein involved in sister chromatid separation and/or segregation [Moesziomyces antarcticus T-34]